MVDAGAGARSTIVGVRSTVVVVTWRGRDHIDACLDALAKQHRPHSTLVVDNASDDGTAQRLAAHQTRPQVLRLPRNKGYAGALAAALDHVRTPFVAWLNDDAAPAPEWLAELEDELDGDPRAAAAGAVLRSPAGDVSSAGVRLTTDGHGADLTAVGQPFGFCGGAALLRTAALVAAGGVPAGFFCYYEDTDTAWRLRLAGWRVLVVAGAVATHAHGASSRLGSFRFHRWNERNRLLMLVRCAPAAVALTEIARFATLTMLLPFRRLTGRSAGRSAGRLTGRTTPAPNFTLRLRLLVLADIAARAPAALWARWLIGRRGCVRRSVVWRTWAGRM